MSDLISCPICHSKSFEKYISGNVKTSENLVFSPREPARHASFNYYRCLKCELLFSDRMLSEGEVHKKYESANFSTHRFSAEASKTYIELIQDREINLSLTDYILDIGTSDGAFLKRLVEAGYSNVFGIEPSVSAWKCIPDELQNNVLNSNFSEDSFKDRKFGCVVSFQTIEHIYRPLDFFRNVYQKLSSGGYFLIVAHDEQAFVNRMLNSFSPIYDVQHFQVFNKKSLSLALEEVGFKVQNASSFKNCYSFEYWLSLLPISEMIKKALFRLLPRLILNFKVKINVGNLFVVARKVNDGVCRSSF